MKITINRIPSGTYKIQMVNGSIVKSMMFTTKPGVQDIVIDNANSDWDLSEAYVFYNKGGTSTYVLVGGITGSTPEVSTLRIVFSEDSYGELTVSDNDPNFTGAGVNLKIVGSSITTNITSCDLILYDVDGKVVGKATGVSAGYKPVMPT